MRSFTLHDHLLDDGQPPLFLPEIGTFFNQDIDIARKLISELRDAGATVIKGEVLHDADIALDDDTPETYLDVEGNPVTERYRDLIERKVVPLADYESLFGHCRSEGLGLVLSVYDFRGAEFARDIGASALKIASSNIVHRPLIEHVARIGLPMVIDTGKSTLEEIARAVQWAEDAGARDIMVQHSPEAPPAPIENHHMRMLPAFRRIFDRPVGLSDHFHGEEMLYVAIALGAHSVEKGIYPDALQAEQDIHHAMPLSRVAEVMEKCRRVHLALGSEMRYLRRDRVKYISRMGLAAGADLEPGDRIDLRNVHFAFPARGIPVEHWEIVEGWTLRRAVSAGHPIRWSDVEPPAA